MYNHKLEDFIKACGLDRAELEVKTTALEKEMKETEDLFPSVEAELIEKHFNKRELAVLAVTARRELYALNQNMQEGLELMGGLKDRLEAIVGADVEDEEITS